jgi:hypothetical protein
MSDVARTAQREAAISTVALAMSKWGCCGDPNIWKIDHLRDALERSLRLSSCKYIGDAFLLACSIFDSTGFTEVYESPDACSAHRVTVTGRWEFATERQEGHALHPRAKHFAMPRTILLFEPVESELGGLGAPPSATLLEAGILALGQLCQNGLRGGKCSYTWLPYQDLCKLCPELKLIRRAKAEHAALIQWLSDRGVEPCEGESRRRFHMPSGMRKQLALAWHKEDVTLTERRQVGAEVVDPTVVADDFGAQMESDDDTEVSFSEKNFTHGLATEIARERAVADSTFSQSLSAGKDWGQVGRVASDVDSFEELMDELRVALKREPGDQGSVEIWHQRIKDVFGTSTPPAGNRTWRTGAADREAWAQGVHVVCILSEERRTETFGGELCWGLRAGGDWDVSTDFAIGDDMCRIGWEREAWRLRRSIEFDADGWPFWEQSTCRMGMHEVGTLPPLLQLMIRARIMLGPEVPVLEISGGKWHTTHVSLDVQEANWYESCSLQARYDFNVAFTSDAGKGVERNADGVPVLDDGRAIPVIGCGVVRHDGVKWKFAIDRTLGVNNYIGELGAIVRALLEVRQMKLQKARVALVFDATSPVRA